MVFSMFYVLASNTGILSMLFCLHVVALFMPRVYGGGTHCKYNYVNTLSNIL